MIEKLEMFIALARERHFGRAAQTHGVTQPTLSSAIRALEESLGAQLVARGARFEGLTPEGERVLAWARKIVADAREMRAEMRGGRRGAAGVLRLGVIPTAMARVARITGPLLAQNPDLELVIRSASAAEILSGLEAYEFDAGVSYLEGLPARVLTAPFYEERYQLVAKGAGGAVTWAEAAQMSLCALTSEMQNRQIIDRHLAEAGASGRVRLASNSVIALLSHVARGDWAAIVPEALVEGLMLPAGVAARPLIAPEVSHPVGIVSLPRELIGAGLKAFLALAR